VLVGFMGVGKSTVGPLVAERLGWDFLDMDEQLEERLGMSVAEYFRARGEEAFRGEERQMALELLERERLVVAAGGGAFANDDTRNLLKRNAVTVWLRCDVDEIVRRVPADGRRPLAGNREIMTARLADREPSYREADVHVAAEDAEPGAVADRVVSAVRERLE
jgi:shikimate kinase